MLTKNFPSRTIRHIAGSLLVALFACYLLSACGANETGPQTAVSAAPYAAEASKDLIPDVPQEGAGAQTALTVEGSAPALAAPNATSGAAGYDAGGITQPQDSRKTILYTTLDMETLTFDETCTKLQQAVSATGGYVAGATINGSETSYKGRTAAFTLKIPREKFDSFSFGLSSLGTIIQRSEAAEDITSQYVDVEARLVALETQEARLLALMEEAGSLEELLQVQQQLTNVQYEIELYRSTQRTYDSLIEYATIDISLREVKEYTPPLPDSFGSRVSAALSNTWHNTVAFLQNFGIFLINALPAIVVLGLVLAIMLGSIKAARKRHAKHPKRQPTIPAPAGSAAQTPQAGALEENTTATTNTPENPATGVANTTGTGVPAPGAAPPPLKRADTGHSGAAGEKKRGKKTPLANKAAPDAEHEKT